MNRHLEEAYEIVAEIEAVLYSIDDIYMEYAESNIQALHALLRNLTKRLATELDLIAEDRKVVDAIFAVNSSKTMNIEK